MVDQSPVAHEQERLRQAREDGVPWRTWGPYLSERQWGTVREDYSANGDAWNSFPARPGPLARLSLGRGRHRRLLRRPDAALLRGRPVERPGRDHQGAALRPHQRGGQPRRGREGVLLLPRRHAHELVPQAAVQVSPGRLPVRRTGPCQRDPQPLGARVRADRYGRVRRRPVLRRVRRVRQGHARGDPGPDQRREPRAGGRGAAGAAAPLVPEHLVALAGGAEAVPRARVHPARHARRSSPSIPTSAPATSSARTRASSCSPTNETNLSAALQPSQHESATSRTASTTTS